jgi:hypothetical protein
VFQSMEEQALTMTGFLIPHARRAAPNQTASGSPDKDFLLITGKEIGAAQGSRPVAADLVTDRLPCDILVQPFSAYL